MIPRFMISLCLALALGLPSCGPDSQPVVFYPGDTLLDDVEALEVVAYPQTNVPKDIAALLDESEVRMVSSPLEAWFQAGARPPRFAKALADRPDVLHRQADVVSVGIQASQSLRVLHGDREPATWDPKSEPFPGLVTWLEEEGRVIHALSVDEPQDVRLSYLVSPQELLGDVEVARFMAKDQAVTPLLLLRRKRLGDSSRTGLLAPSGTTLRLSVDFLATKAMDFALGAVNVGLARVGDALQSASLASDGLEFEVRAVSEGQRHVLFHHRMEAQEIGREYVDGSIDLGAYFGKAVVLEFATLPGPQGNGDFDYGFWSGLRFNGPEGLWESEASQPLVEMGAWRRPDTRPNVLLVDIDTLRADRLSALGYKRLTTPRLDRWMESEAVLYDNARTTAPWTLPATASMLTGLSTPQHAVRTFPDALTAGAETLASRLRAAGYETFAIAEEGYLDPVFGFDLGFDQYHVCPKKDPDWSRAVRWLETRESRRPFFLFLHTYFVHAPYYPNDMFADPDYDGPLKGKGISADIFRGVKEGTLELDEADQEYIECLYDALVKRVDDIVLDFFDELRRLHLHFDTMIIFTSDHGEEFFEHGLIGHAHSLYEELLHVPLAIKYPRKEVPADRVSDPTSILDIVPTVLDVVGLEIPEVLAGQSLLQPIEAARPRHAFVDELFMDSLEVGAYKFIRFSPPNPENRIWKQLYDRRIDPGETINMVNKLPDVVELFGKRLDHYKQTHPRVTEEGHANVGSSQLSALKELGYIDGAP